MRLRRPIWPGILALLISAASFTLHVLYGRLHWPDDGTHRAAGNVLDALHLGAFAMALLAIGFAFVCLRLGNRWLGLIALALAVGATINSMICY